MNRTVINLLASAAFAAIVMAASSAVADCEDDGDESDYVAAYGVPARSVLPSTRSKARAETVMAEKAAPRQPDGSNARPAGAAMARVCKRYFPGAGEVLPVPCE